MTLRGPWRQKGKCGQCVRREPRPVLLPCVGWREPLEARVQDLTVVFCGVDAIGWGVECVLWFFYFNSHPSNLPIQLT